MYSQFKVKYDYSQNLKYLKYHEHSAKNNQGGLKSLNTKQKVAVAYENTTNPEHCLVCLYELYLSKRPSHVPKCSHDLYLHPLSNPKNPHVWYSCLPIGVHTLAKVIAKMCEAGGLGGKSSNHSLRSTAATRLYQNGVEEQQIATLTGHHSVAVRNYKRMGDLWDVPGELPQFSFLVIFSTFPRVCGYIIVPFACNHCPKVLLILTIPFHMI